MKAFLLLSLLVALCASQALDFNPEGSREVGDPYWLQEGTWSTDVSGRPDLEESVIEFSLQAVQFGYPCYYSVWVDSRKVSNGAFTNVAANVIPLLPATIGANSEVMSVRTMNCHLGRYAIPFLFNGTGATQASASVTLIDISPSAQGSFVPTSLTITQNPRTGFPDNFEDASNLFSTYGLGLQDGNCLFSSQACEASDSTTTTPFFYGLAPFRVDFSSLTANPTNGYVVEVSGWSAGAAQFSYRLCNTTSSASCNAEADWSFYAGDFIDSHTAYTENTLLGSNPVTASGVDENKFFRTFFQMPLDLSDYFKGLLITPTAQTLAVFFPYAKVWNLDINNDDLHQVLRVDPADAGDCVQTYSGYPSVGGIDLWLPGSTRSNGYPEYGVDQFGEFGAAYGSPVAALGTALDEESFFWICPPAAVAASLWSTGDTCTTMQNTLQANSGASAQTASVTPANLAFANGFGLVYSLDLGSPTAFCNNPAVQSVTATGLLSYYDVLINSAVAVTVAQHQATHFAERGYTSGIGSLNGFHLGEDTSASFNFQYRSVPGFSMTINNLLFVHAVAAPDAASVCVDRATSCNGRGECANRQTGACKCDLGFTGATCDLLVQYCQPGLCFNGGECSENPLRSEDPNFPGKLSQPIICDCDSTISQSVSGQPFQGPLCEILPPCDAKPCLNGGVCNATGLNTYSCDCSGTLSPYSLVNPYTGVHCEIPQTAPCERNPCQNAATCTDSGPGTFDYTCACTAGWLGTNCEIPPLNQCDNTLCGTHGVCIPDASANSQPKAFTRCLCLDGWGGVDCLTEPTACAGKCKNGGVCIHDALRLAQGADSGNFACICPPPWVGTDCQHNSTLWNAASGSAVGLLPLLFALLVSRLF